MAHITPESLFKDRCMEMWLLLPLGTDTGLALLPAELDVDHPMAADTAYNLPGSPLPLFSLLRVWSGHIRLASLGYVSV